DRRERRHRGRLAQPSVAVARRGKRRADRVPDVSAARRVGGASRHGIERAHREAGAGRLEGAHQQLEGAHQQSVGCALSACQLRTGNNSGAHPEVQLTRMKFARPLLTALVVVFAATLACSDQPPTSGAEGMSDITTLRVTDNKVGSGAQATAGKQVTVHY